MSYLKHDVSRFKNRVFAVLGTYDDKKYDDMDRIIRNLKNDISKCYDLENLTDSSMCFIEDLEHFVNAFNGTIVSEWVKRDVRKLVFNTLNKIERYDADEL